MTTIVTPHGVMRINAHWLDSAEACVQRWTRAQMPKAPTTGPYVFDLAGQPVLPPQMES